MSELTFGPPTTAPVAVATRSSRTKRIGRWIVLAAIVVLMLALAGRFADERSTSSSLRDDVAEADTAWREIAGELDTTKADLDATSVALSEATTAIAAATERAEAAETTAQRLGNDVARAERALDSTIVENVELTGERDAATAAANAAVAAQLELETAVRRYHIALFSHGEEALTPEQAECFYDDLVEFAGVDKVLAYDAIFAADGDLPPDGERAYGHAYFECV